MKLHFIKVNPVENMTIFILDQISKSKHMEIAKKVMDYSNIYAEQVGFIERSLKGDFLKLQMMGGEFCGNATRSLAALVVHNRYPYIIEDKDKYIIYIDVSGSEEIIKCEVRKTDIENIYKSKINMPLPLDIKEYSIKDKENTFEITRVDFPGISHFIVNDEKIDNRDYLYKLIKKEMNRKEYDAFGIMYYDYEKEFITPLVYVKGTDSLFWERSCASGTTALAVALAYKSKSSINKSIKQPGGTLDISVKWKKDEIKEISLDGLVEIVGEGILYIS